MSNEQKVNVRFDEDKSHAWINGTHQYVSLERFLQVQRDLNKETTLLRKEVERLSKENESYRTLLRVQLNKED